MDPRGFESLTPCMKCRGAASFATIQETRRFSAKLLMVLKIPERVVFDPSSIEGHSRVVQVGLAGPELSNKCRLIDCCESIRMANGGELQRPQNPSWRSRRGPPVQVPLRRFGTIRLVAKARTRIRGRTTNIHRFARSICHSM